MVITLSQELSAALNLSAREMGTTPESLAEATLRDRFLPNPKMVPQDEWERKLLAAATDCGVSLSDAALSREVIYE